MPKKKISDKSLSFNEEAYNNFLSKINDISHLIETKISNKIDRQAIFVSNEQLGQHISEPFKSKPEEFTKDNIIIELLEFLGYDKSSRVPESELKKMFGIRWPDYRLIVSPDTDILVEAEPLNTDLRAEGHGVNQVIDWIRSKGVTNHGIATDGLRWILIEYSLEYRKHKEVISIDISPFFLDSLGFDSPIRKSEKEQIFAKFYNFFSKEFIESTLAKKTVELENYEEDISNRFYKEYMRLVFGDKANSISLVNSITNVTDLEARKRIAQVIINRLIFIKFIEARGWLNKNKSFLSDLIKTYNKAPTGKMYNSIIKVLFFDVLNNPDDGEKKGIFADIKYLNGGLFTQIKEEEANPTYSVKDDILVKVIEFLEKYKFEGKAITKLERSNGGEENLMSPEILGYIFERTANHEHGAYYTPENVTGFITDGTVGEYILNTINTRLKELDIHPIKKLSTFSEVEELDKQELSALYERIKSIKILDPGCGSGAFFMPVIGLLMQVHSIFTNKLGLPFKEYDIKKQIIENNIFGSEINPDAVEIAKLRLWLELVSTAENVEEIDLLPNIDYNIIAGNSLFGFDIQTKANGIHAYIPLDIEELVDILSANYKNKADRIMELNEKPIMENTLRMKDILLSIYRDERNPEVSKLVKKIIEKINLRLKANLNKSYSGYLKQNYKFDITEEEVTSYRPIHWMLEFHNIMTNGGFDIFLGNPPYVEITSNIDYPLIQYDTLKCGNTYAPFFERGIRLLKNGGYFSYIVPISSICTDRMAKLQELLIKNTDVLKISNYDDRPDKIFKGLEHCRSSIIFGHKNENNSHEVYSTHYHRWYAVDRDSIFRKMKYLDVTKQIKPGIIPKLGNKIEIDILEKINKDNPLANSLGSTTDNPIIYHNAPQYWIRALDFMPEFKNSKGAKISPHNKIFYISDKTQSKSIIAALNSSLFYWFFIINSNCRDLTDREIQTFTFDPSSLKANEKKQLETLADKLMEDYKTNSKRKDTQYKTTGNVVYQEFYPKLSKSIIDKIDNVIFDHYNFSDEERNYIRNFDLQFKMGNKCESQQKT
jgi:hypothetical protein